MTLVLTRAALALQATKTDVEVVKFQSYKPKKKTGENVDTEKMKSDVATVQVPRNRKDLDLKKIRHEVVKFGMSGFDSTKKEEAKIALAVSLGAIPPKKEYINYKELIKKRKEEKRQQSEDKKLMMFKAALNGAGKSKKRKGGNDVGHLLGGYGKVQKKEIQKEEGASKIKRKRK